jgi:hypothetical protein
MRQFRATALVLTGVLLSALAAACGSETPTATDTDTTTPAAAPSSNGAVSGSIPRHKIMVDLTISGDINVHLAGLAGSCEPDHFGFQGDELGSSAFTFVVEGGSRPQLAMNVGGESYFSYQRGAKGTFDMATNNVTLDLDVLNFHSGSVHMKGSLTCGA